MQLCLCPSLCPWLSHDSMCLPCAHTRSDCSRPLSSDMPVHSPPPPPPPPPETSWPSDDAVVSITPSTSYLPPPCNRLYIFVSFLPPPPRLPPPPLFFSLRLSCQLFIRCVNNCLPTVVIAPPCQPEVWSKWQCAQFSLAYIIQFLVSLVPLARKKNPPSVAVVFLSVGFVFYPINICVFHSDITVSRHFALLLLCQNLFPQEGPAERQGHGVNTAETNDRFCYCSVAHSLLRAPFTVGNGRCVSLCWFFSLVLVMTMNWNVYFVHSPLWSRMNILAAVGGLSDPLPTLIYNTSPHAPGVLAGTHGSRSPYRNGFGHLMVPPGPPIWHLHSSFKWNSSESMCAHPQDLKGMQSKTPYQGKKRPHGNHGFY